MNDRNTSVTDPRGEGDRDRRRRKATRAAMPEIVRRIARLGAEGAVGVGDAEYLIREMQQSVMDGEGAR